MCAPGWRGKETVHAVVWIDMHRDRQSILDSSSSIQIAWWSPAAMAVSSLWARDGCCWLWTRMFMSVLGMWWGAQLRGLFLQQLVAYTAAAAVWKFVGNIGTLILAVRSWGIRAWSLGIGVALSSSATAAL